MKRFRFYWEKTHKKDPKINIELPGFSKDEINVSIEKGYINISAEKKEQKVERGRGFYRAESSQQSFKRSMSLPKNVKPEDLAVEIRDGFVRIKRKKKRLEKTY